MKVNKSSENRGMLSKGTSTEITTHEGGFLNFLRPLVAAGVPLTKRVLTSLDENVLISLGLSARISAADAAIQKNIYWSVTTAFRISNEDIKDIAKKIKSLKEWGLLIKGISETIKNEAK